MIFKKRVKLFMLFVVFLFLFASIVSADLKKLKDDWFEYDESFTVGSDVFNVRVCPHPCYDLIRVSREADPFTLNLGSCTNFENYRFCYENYSLSKKATMDDVYDRVRVGVNIVVYDLGDDFNARVTSSESGNKFLHHTYTASVKIENTGKTNMRNGEIVIEIPEGVTVLSSRDFIISGNTLRKTFSLATGRDVTYRFNYKVVEEGAQRFNYDVLEAGKSVRKSNFNVRGVVPYSISFDVPRRLEVRTPADVRLKIENKHPSAPLQIDNLEVIAPVSFSFLAFTRLNSLRHGFFTGSSFSIPPASERTYDLRFRSWSVGDFSFDYNIALTQLDTYYVEDSKTVQIYNEGLNPVLKFLRKDISRGADTVLVLSLHNDHPTATFTNVDVSLESELFNFSRVHASIRPGESVDLVNQRLTPDQEGGNKVYNAKAVVNFINHVGAREVVELSDSFRLVSDGALLRVTHKVTPTRAEAGDEVIVEVLVRNLMDNSFDRVEVESFLPRNYNVIVGGKEASFSMTGNSETQAFMYKFVVPDRPTSNRLDIKTSAFIPGINYTVEATSNVRIDGEIFDEDYVEVDEDDESSGIDDADDVDDVDDVDGVDDVDDVDASNGSGDESVLIPIEEERDGFFRRMIRGVQQFFAGIFGGN